MNSIRLFCIWLALSVGTGAGLTVQSQTTNPRNTAEYTNLLAIVCAYQQNDPTSVKNLQSVRGRKVCSYLTGIAWVKLMPKPTVLEYNLTSNNRSELIFQFSWPNGEDGLRVAVTFFRDSEGQWVLDDVLLFAPDYDLWVSRNTGQSLKAPRWFYKIFLLRAKAQEIASQTHEYDKLAKQTREFQDLAFQCGYGGNASVSNFVAAANALIGFGASWKDVVSASRSELSSTIKQEIETTVKLAISNAGGTMNAEARAALSEELSEKLSVSTENTIHKLDDKTAPIFTALEANLSKAYDGLLDLTSAYAAIPNR